MLMKRCLPNQQMKLSAGLGFVIRVRVLAICNRPSGDCTVAASVPSCGNGSYRNACQSRTVCSIQMFACSLLAALLIGGLHSDCSAGAASWQVINLNGTASYGSAAYAVSGNSQVGWGNWAGSQRAAAWTGTADSGLQLASDGYAFGLGADGQDKAGYTGFFFTRAVLWRGEASILVNLQPEGALESNAAAAHAGTQVGAVDFGAGIHAATWHGTSGTFTDVNPSWAEVSGLLAIDASGQVGITVSRNDGSVPQHAALWHGSADSAVDLHPAGAYASRAQAISNGRQGGMCCTSVTAPTTPRSGAARLAAL